MSDEPDLSLVSTEALIEELAGRYDGLLVVREKFRTEESCDTLYDFNGGISRAIGMAERIKARLLARCEKTGRGCEPEDV